MDSQGRAQPYQEASELFLAGRYAEALPLYQELANAGDSLCQVFLGWMYYEGLGVSRDQDTAFVWFRRAADLGSREGAFYCGKHAIARGDYQEALSWFRASTCQDYGPALLWLGIMHKNGLGVSVDLDRASRYLRRAIANGSFPAERELSLMMMRGQLGILQVPVGVLRLVLCTVKILARILVGRRADAVDALMG